MADNFAQTVKQQADIVKIVGEYVRLKKAGAQNFSGLCPFHSEKSPSFSVHAGRQFYHCFGCGVGGDVFSFIQKIENVSFPEAVKSVAVKCGIPLPKREFSSAEEAAESRQRSKLIELHEAATAWFEQQLKSPEGALAREYLAGRGMTEAGIAKFRIGYAPDSFHALRERLAGMADEATLRASGLFSWKEQEGGKPGPLYARFRKRITFPIANESGRVIAFTARALESGDKAGPKYMNSPETALYTKGLVLFNLDKARSDIRKFEFALLVEGQMDCISAYLAGIPNVLATSGTAFTEAQVKLLKRYTRRVIVSLDDDNAGRQAMEKSILLLIEDDFDVKVAPLPDGYDPDGFIREQGVKAYMAILRSAHRFQDYLIERAMYLFPQSTPQAKVEAINFLLPYIAHFPNRIIRESFALDAAQKLSIDSALVREEFRQAASRRKGNISDAGNKPRTLIQELISPVAIPSDTKQEFGLTKSEMILLLAFSAPKTGELYQSAEAAYREHEADFASMREDVREMLERLRARAEGDDPMQVLTGAGQRQMLAGVLVSVHGADPELSDVEGAIMTLRRASLEQEQRKLRQAIQEAERAGKVDEALALSRELHGVAMRLRNLD